MPKVAYDFLIEAFNNIYFKLVLITQREGAIKCSKQLCFYFLEAEKDKTTFLLKIGSILKKYVSSKGLLGKIEHEKTTTLRDFVTMIYFDFYKSINKLKRVDSVNVSELKSMLNMEISSFKNNKALSDEFLKKYSNSCAKKAELSEETQKIIKYLNNCRIEKGVGDEY